MLAIAVQSSLAFNGAVVAPATRASVHMTSAADLKDLAKSCNPTVGFW